MKRITASALVMVALVMIALATGALAAEQKAEIAVGGLTCPSCVYIVSTAMKQVPTVEITKFQETKSRTEGTFSVTYDDARATPDMIAEAVSDYGYPASVVSGD